MKSMTGYGRASLECSGLSGNVEISSINKKGFELIVHLPKEWQMLEKKASNLIRKKISRGRIRLAISFDLTSSNSSNSLGNTELISQQLKHLQNFCEAREITFSPTPELIVRLASSAHDSITLPALEQEESSLINAIEESVCALIEMREKEGTILRKDLFLRTKIIKDLLINLRKTSQGMAKESMLRLKDRLKENGLDISDDDERVAKEIVLFADKCDVSEELTRIGSHLEQFEDCISSTQPVGRKLEFIVQEIGRELNTLGSKSFRPQLSNLVIEAKVELEKIREQILNVE